LVPFYENILNDNVTLEQLKNNARSRTSKEIVGSVSTALFQCFRYYCDAKETKEQDLPAKESSLQERDLKDIAKNELETMGFKTRRKTNIRRIEFDLVGSKLERLGLQEKVAVGVVYTSVVDRIKLAEVVQKVEEARKVENRISTVVVFAPDFDDSAKAFLIDYSKKENKYTIFMKILKEK